MSKSARGWSLAHRGRRANVVLRWRALASGLSLLALLGPGACAHAPSMPERLRSTPLGDELSALWRAHGNIESWREFRGARFRLVVETDGLAATLPEVLIDFRDQERVWVRAGDPPARWIEISLAPEIASDSVEARRREELADALGFPGWRLDPARGGPLDYSLRSVRSLFQLPHALSGPGWQLRRVIGDSATAGEFEASPWREGFLVGPFLLNVSGDAANEPLRRVTYLSSHAVVRPSLREARFSDYTDLLGVLVSRRREHVILTTSVSLEIDDPFVRPSERAEPSVFLVERLESLALVEAAELEHVRESASAAPNVEPLTTP